MGVRGSGVAGERLWKTTDSKIWVVIVIIRDIYGKILIWEHGRKEG